MKYVLVLILLLLVFVTVFLFSPLKIVAEYREAKLKLIFKCLFIKVKIDDSKFKAKKSQEAKLENKKTSANAFGRIKDFKENYGNVKDILGEILNLVRNKAEFSGIYVRIRYGTGEAAITGMIYGGIWSLVGSFYSFLCRFFRIEFPKLELEPIFGEKAFEIEAEGIITTKPVHIITAVLRSAKIYKKHKKEKGAK